ncbi:MAG TPA: penicillin-binding transpeptidase domain-containing protein, partial [Aestuariivirga sp.]
IAQRNLDSPDWFLDWAYEQTIALLEEQRLLSDYVIEVKTTVDVKLQTAAQKILNDVVDTEGPGYRFSQAASVTMTPEGAVKAIVGGRNYESSQFNRATNAERQTGSAFKPFVYLAALLEGYTPDRMVVDAPISVGGWSPGNYSGKYGGRITMTTALAKSYNSVPVRLMVDIGRPAIIKTAHDVGIQGELETWPPMVLGTSALTLMDVTRGYATFAGGGKLAEPYTILEIRRPNGDIIYDRSKFAKPAKQVVPEEKIAELNSMLKEVVKSGTARRADLGFAPQGGKTGTNQAYRDAWYIGFTAHNVTGVWVGNDDFTPMNKVTGGLVPAPAWKRIMEVAEEGQQPTSLAGIPLDETYAVAATEPPANTTLIANEETGIITVDTGSQPANADSVAVVLNDMFSLFEKKKPVKKATKTTDTKVAKAPDDTLVLPDANANVDSEGSFIENLFIPVEPEKKKKKKKSILKKVLGVFD